MRDVDVDVRTMVLSRAITIGARAIELGSAPMGVAMGPFMGITWVGDEREFQYHVPAPWVRALADPSWAGGS